eukprot:668703-Amphidinium_carterae.1
MPFGRGASAGQQPVKTAEHAQELAQTCPIRHKAALALIDVHVCNPWLAPPRSVEPTACFAKGSHALRQPSGPSTQKTHHFHLMIRQKRLSNPQA